MTPVLLLLLVAAAPVAAREPTCRTLCREQIAAECLGLPRYRACVRRIVAGCRLDRTSCGGTTTTTTTQTTSTTTTTIRWVLGATVPQSCDAACAARGLVCDLAATRDVVGSGGTSEACLLIGQALSARPVAAYPDAALPQCGPDLAVGCMVGSDLFHPAQDAVVRITDPPTTCGADGVSPLCDSRLRRVCACIDP